MPDSLSIHHTDRDDALVQVNQAWLDFARENWDPAFSSDRVLGTRLWSHITDSSTSHLYHLILEAARDRGLKVTVPYRCDSPTLRRYMEMEVSALAGGIVRWSSRILRQEEREPAPILAAGIPRSYRLLALCAWCKRFRVPDWALAQPWAGQLGSWWEVEHLGGMMRGLAEEELPQVTHTVCPQCFDMVMRRMEEDVA